MIISENTEEIRKLLTNARTIAVVGCSPKPERDSHGVTQYLIESGYDVFPINPGHKEILGRQSYPDLTQLPVKIDVVNIFRRPEHVPDIVNIAIEIGAGGVWLQLGVGNKEAEKMADEAGLWVVSEKCIKVAHTILRIPKK